MCELQRKKPEPEVSQTQESEAKAPDEAPGQTAQPALNAYRAPFFWALLLDSLKYPLHEL